MERRHLESAAADYPYLQGLWMIPLGIGIIVAGISNLQDHPTGIGALVLILGGLGAGRGGLPGDRSLLPRPLWVGHPDPRPDHPPGPRARCLDRGPVRRRERALFWSPDGPQCIYASAFALATLAYYAILVGLRPHHLVIWGAVFVAGLLPIWGGLGVDRDALAMIPLGLAAMLSGLLDQRVLARSLAMPAGDRLEGTRVGG